MGVGFTSSRVHESGPRRGECQFNDPRGMEGSVDLGGQSKPGTWNWERATAGASFGCATIQLLLQVSDYELTNRTIYHASRGPSVCRYTENRKQDCMCFGGITVAGITPKWHSDETQSKPTVSTNRITSIDFIEFFCRLKTSGWESRDCDGACTNLTSTVLESLLYPILSYPV